MIHLTVCLLSLHCIYKIIAIHAVIHRLTQANTTACFFYTLDFGLGVNSSRAGAKTKVYVC